MTYIPNRTFTTSKGHIYEVIATEYGTSKDVLDSIDTVKNSKGVKKK